MQLLRRKRNLFRRIEKLTWLSQSSPSSSVEELISELRFAYMIIMNGLGIQTSCSQLRCCEFLPCGQDNGVEYLVFIVWLHFQMFFSPFDLIYKFEPSFAIFGFFLNTQQYVTCCITNCFILFFFIRVVFSFCFRYSNSQDFKICFIFILYDLTIVPIYLIYIPSNSV